MNENNRRCIYWQTCGDTEHIMEESPPRLWTRKQNEGIWDYSKYTFTTDFDMYLAVRRAYYNQDDYEVFDSIEELIEEKFVDLL